MLTKWVLLLANRRNNADSLSQVVGTGENPTALWFPLWTVLFRHGVRAYFWRRDSGAIP